MSPSINWPFDEPPSTGVYSLRRIIFDGHPILYVVHDHEGDWQFLDGLPMSEKDACVLALDEVAALDPTVLALATLPVGWFATRSQPGGMWNRNHESR